jgi:hypothetical protein
MKRKYRFSMVVDVEVEPHEDPLIDNQHGISKAESAVLAKLRGAENRLAFVRMFQIEELVGELYPDLVGGES